jgi:hypothetical protein
LLERRDALRDDDLVLLTHRGNVGRGRRAHVEDGIDGLRLLALHDDQAAASVKVTDDLEAHVRGEEHLVLCREVREVTDVTANGLA